MTTTKTRQRHDIQKEVVETYTIGIEILREELEIKNEQIKTLEQLLDQSHQLQLMLGNQSSISKENLDQREKSKSETREPS